jgi:hypothetical protein
MPEMVMIEAEELDRLRKAEHWLSCLEAAGIDGWDGYSYASSIYHGEETEPYGWAD